MMMKIARDALALFAFGVEEIRIDREINMHKMSSSKTSSLM